MVKVDVRQATREDLDKLVAREPVEAKRIYEVERFEAQERGESALLIAWDENDEIRGRVRLYWQSKYPEVTKDLGPFPEINALDAWPTGTGVGSQIIEACERISRERGFDRIGIAVELANEAALRLYERVGFEHWGRVIDEWAEYDDDGRVDTWHQDPAYYLSKML